MLTFNIVLFFVVTISQNENYQRKKRCNKSAKHDIYFYYSLTQIKDEGTI
jgi:hypothetical protein